MGVAVAGHSRVWREGRGRAGYAATGRHGIAHRQAAQGHVAGVLNAHGIGDDIPRVRHAGGAVVGGQGGGLGDA